jgi:hypothetical protein
MTQYDYDEIFVIIYNLEGLGTEITQERNLKVTDSNISIYLVLVDLMENLVRLYGHEITKYEVTWQRRKYNNDDDITIMEEQIILVDDPGV